MIHRLVTRWKTPLPTPGLMRLAVLGIGWGSQYGAFKAIKFSKENCLKLFHWVPGPALFSCVWVLRKRPSAQLTVLPLTVHQRKLHHHKRQWSRGRGGLLYEWWQKEMPCCWCWPVGRETTVHLGQCLGNFAFLFYYGTKEKCSN